MTLGPDRFMIGFCIFSHFSCLRGLLQKCRQQVQLQKFSSMIFLDSCFVCFYGPFEGIRPYFHDYTLPLL